MNVIATSTRLAIAGLTASLLAGCGALPIHATLDKLTSETQTRSSDFFDFVSLVSISGLAPQHGAQLMFHQPDFYGKEGSSAYSVGVSPGRSFVVEMTFPMSDSPCVSSADGAKNVCSPAKEKTEQPVTDAGTKSASAKPACDTHAQAVLCIRNDLETIRDFSTIMLTQRVEKDLAETLLTELKSSVKDSNKFAAKLSGYLGGATTDADAAKAISDLSDKDRKKLQSQINGFVKKCDPSADAKNAPNDTPLPKCGATATQDVIDQLKGFSTALEGKDTQGYGAILDAKKALGKIKLGSEEQITLATALLGSKAVDKESNIDYSQIASRREAAEDTIKAFQEKIAVRSAEMRDLARQRNVVISRWTRDKRGTLSGALSDFFSTTVKRHEAVSGVMVMGDLRTTTLFTGEDIADLLRYSQGRYLELLDQIGITTFAVQAKHVAYSADRDMETAIAGRFSLTPEQLRALSKVFDKADLEVNFGAGVGLDLGNSGFISTGRVKNKPTPFFPPSAMEASILKELDDSCGYQTIFAVRAKLKSPFIEKALRMNTDLLDAARSKCNDPSKPECKQRKDANARIAAAVSAGNKKDDASCTCGTDSAKDKDAPLARITCLLGCEKFPVTACPPKK